MTANQKDTVDPYKSITDGQNQRLKLTTDSPFTPIHVQQALTLSSDPAGIYESRVKDRHVLLENPARESRAKKERAAKQARKHAEKHRKKLRPLGRNAAESKGLWKLEKHATRFELFVPLHQLWMGYMSELLGLRVPDVSSSSSHEGKMPGASSMHAKLVKADINGALLTVRQSRNPCLVGLSGIVLHETENAFKLITRKNKLKLVPKQNSIFTLAVPLYSTLSPSTIERDPVQTSQQQERDATLWTVVDKPYIEFDLYGSQFCFRSADRSNRKFKAKETIEL
ncbi:RNase P subunit p29-like protein [Boletus reticuloceps]|uniref:Ribonuclease P protein subunit n=1 Tax=Boletus reticuloceps TaxID=495285 RepID=A0A8I2YH51_9AGAM|nr:RNase P subunit p29-like protein [Boletus reticuloceps]